MGRRIGLTSAIFGKLGHIFKFEIPVCFKRKVQPVRLASLTYGSETLTFTRRAMERSMLGIVLKDRVPNEQIHKKSGRSEGNNASNGIGPHISQRCQVRNGSRGSWNGAPGKMPLEAMDIRQAVGQMT